MSQVYFMMIALPEGSLGHSPVPKKIEIWHYLNNIQHINRRTFKCCNVNSYLIHQLQITTSISANTDGRATLLHVKSTILHCPPSIITRQRASVDSKLLCRPTTTYLNDNAQTPLNRFAVYMLYSQL